MLTKVCLRFYNYPTFVPDPNIEVQNTNYSRVPNNRHDAIKNTIAKFELITKRHVAIKDTTEFFAIFV